MNGGVLSFLPVKCKTSFRSIQISIYKKKRKEKSALQFFIKKMTKQNHNNHNKKDKKNSCLCKKIKF